LIIASLCERLQAAYIELAQPFSAATLGLGEAAVVMVSDNQQALICDFSYKPKQLRLCRSERILYVKSTPPMNQS